jgi:Flp pilus assembly protein TadD
VGSDDAGARGFFEKANALQESGDLGGAIASFGEAIRLDPGESTYYTFRGIAHAELAAALGRENDNAGRAREFDQAIRDYSRAIELAPNSIAAYYHRGLALARRGDYDGAIRDASKVIDLAPNDAQAYLIRGGAHHDAGDYDSAFADLSMSMSLDPNPATQDMLDMVARKRGGERPSEKIFQSLLMVLTLGIKRIPFSEMRRRQWLPFKGRDGEPNPLNIGFNIVVGLFRYIIPYAVFGFVFHLVRLLYLVTVEIIKAVKRRRAKGGLRPGLTFMKALSAFSGFSGGEEGAGADGSAAAAKQAAPPAGSAGRDTGGGGAAWQMPARPAVSQAASPVVQSVASQPPARPAPARPALSLDELMGTARAKDK